MTPEPPRPYEQRKQDTLDRLTTDIDAWIGTARPDGRPHMIPLSFIWDGEVLLISTAASSVTSRNLLARDEVRVGIGPSRDVVLIEGTAEAVPTVDISPALGDLFAIRTGFDPRELDSPYLYFRVRPMRMQAWREENELAERDLMRAGRWLDEAP